MQQRSELMDIFLSKGITSLDEMRGLYDSNEGNKFEDGGIKKQPVTTGGAGYIPPFPYPLPKRKTVYKAVDGKVFQTLEEAKGHNDILVQRRREREQQRQQAIRPNYIGGTKDEVRQKYFDIDKEFTDSVVSISKRYGLKPEVTASRIAREGPIDSAVSIYYI